MAFFVFLCLLYAGPSNQHKTPLVVHVAHHLASVAQLTLAVTRWSSAWSAGAPTPEAHASYLHPAANMLAGVLILTLESCSGRLGPWGCLRARYLVHSVVGLCTAFALWYCSDGQMVGYPPGPTTLGASLATWSLVGLMGLSLHSRVRYWMWERMPRVGRDVRGSDGLARGV